MVVIQLPTWLSRAENLPRELTGEVLRETGKAVLFKGTAVVRPSITCLRCGRELNNPASRVVGYGPECCAALGIARPDFEDAQKLDAQIRQATQIERWFPKSHVTILGDYKITPADDDRPRAYRVEQILRVKVPYDDRNRIKSIPGYAWNTTTKTWDFPLDQKTLRALSRVFNGTLEIEEGLLEPSSHAGLESLFEYQREGVEFLVDTERALLADDMGLGKTVQAITAALRVGKKILVTCPNSIKWNWENEINKWVPEATVQVVDGDRSSRVNQIRSDAQFTIINLEALRLYVDNIRAVVWDVFIIDEAHRIKNRYVKQSGRGPQVTKAAYEISRHIPRTFLLTGTPIMNRPDELWSLLHCLAPQTFSSYWKFVERYCLISTDGYGLVVGPVRLDMRDELRAICRAYILRRTKGEKLNLPPMLVQQLWIDLEGEQRRAYHEMARQMYTDLGNGDEVSASVVIAQITRLKQITLDPRLMLGDLSTPIEGAKIDALFDIIDGAGDQKIVVFSQFARALKGLSTRLADRGISHELLIGETSPHARQDAVDRFQADNGPKVFLASMQAGGLGLNLTSASIAVFLDKFWTPAVNAQAAARLHRLGQQKPVTIIELLARGTVEEGIETLLRTKENHFKDLFELDVPERLSPQHLRDLLKFGL